MFNYQAFIKQQNIHERNEKQALEQQQRDQFRLEQKKVFQENYKRRVRQFIDNSIIKPIKVEQYLTKKERDDLVLRPTEPQKFVGGPSFRFSSSVHRSKSLNIINDNPSVGSILNYQFRIRQPEKEIKNSYRFYDQSAIERISTNMHPNFQSIAEV